MYMLANVSFFPPPEEEREEGWKFNYLFCSPLGGPLLALPQTLLRLTAFTRWILRGCWWTFTCLIKVMWTPYASGQVMALLSFPSFGWRFEENKVFISKFFSHFVVREQLFLNLYIDYLVKADGVRVKCCSFSSSLSTSTGRSVSQDKLSFLQYSCSTFVKGKQPSVYLYMEGSCKMDLADSCPKNGSIGFFLPEERETFFHCCTAKYN